MRDRGVLLGSGDAAAPKLASALCSRLSINTTSLKSEWSAGGSNGAVACL